MWAVGAEHGRGSVVQTLRVERTSYVYDMSSASSPCSLSSASPLPPVEPPPHLRLWTPPRSPAAHLAAEPSGASTVDRIMCKYFGSSPWRGRGGGGGGGGGGGVGRGGGGGGGWGGGGGEGGAEDHGDGDTVQDNGRRAGRGGSAFDSAASSSSSAAAAVPAAVNVDVADASGPLDLGDLGETPKLGGALGVSPLASPSSAAAAAYKSKHGSSGGGCGGSGGSGGGGSGGGGGGGGSGSGCGGGSEASPVDRIMCKHFGSNPWRKRSGGGGGKDGGGAGEGTERRTTATAMPRTTTTGGRVVAAPAAAVSTGARMAQAPPAPRQRLSLAA